MVLLETALVISLRNKPKKNVVFKLNKLQQDRGIQYFLVSLMS